MQRKKMPQCRCLYSKPHWDHRGYFLESFREEESVAQLGFHLFQINEVFSYYGAIRGLHMQKSPYGQAKIIQVLQGNILDIAVDVRPESTNFGQVVRNTLRAAERKKLYIPVGFLHGYAVLSATALVQYYVDAPYLPEYEVGVRYDDASLKIDWLLLEEEQLVSKKDLSLPSFEQFLDRNA
ncbi:MAG: dTDP-4-dehydrorhamnose 3,5-epimerase [Neisseriaceae bacterium]